MEAQILLTAVTEAKGKQEGALSTCASSLVAVAAGRRKAVK